VVCTVTTTNLPQHLTRDVYMLMSVYEPGLSSYS